MDDRAFGNHHSIQEQRLARDEMILTELELQAIDADHAVASIRAQMCALQTALRAAQEWRQDVIPRRDALRNSVFVQRSAVSPMSTLQQDVLHCIFQHCVRGYDSAWKPANEPYNAAHAKAPFILAAVCTHWRRTAENAPSLWTYIGVPGQAYPPAQLLEARVETLLRRSKAAPLDILFDCIHATNRSMVQRLLTALYTHVARWRRFYAVIAAELSFPTLLGYLRGSTPLLEDLSVRQNVASVAGHEVSWPTIIPKYLKDAPQLRSCLVRNIPVAWDHSTTKRLELLTHLYLLCHPVSTPLLLTTLRRTPSLQHLSLWSGPHNAEGLHGQSVELPGLLRLVLSHSAPRLLETFPSMLVTPALTSLKLKSLGTRATACAAFFSRLPHTLVRLQLTARSLAPADIPALRMLQNVSDVELACASISGEFFDWLLVRDAARCLWPKLERLALKGVSVESEHWDNLVRAVEARHAVPAFLPVLWAALQSVAIDEKCNIPDWHRADIARILGPCSNTLP